MYVYYWCSSFIIRLDMLKQVSIATVNSVWADVARLLSVTKLSMVQVKIGTLVKV